MAQLPKQEISDEEIDKFAWMDAIKWYREQIKFKKD